MVIPKSKQRPGTTTTQQPWWKDAVVYQIYPRSFADSNADGIGDLQGLTSRLDYLETLGVDALWLSPIYPSPMHDFGYDVADYRGVSPEYGSLDDFRTLLREAHARDIRVVMDMVLNHCSHEHPWFVEARSRRDHPKRDWFIWRDGEAKGRRRREPNNWRGVLGGRAWTWDAASEQYYLHSFLPEQPDLNWRNPELRQAVADVLRYWLDMGVDGFRLDVVNWFLKDELLRDNPIRPRGPRPYDWYQHRFDRDQAETPTLMNEIRQVVDAYPDRFTVGEVFVERPGNAARAASYYADGEGLHLAFDFSFLYCRWDAQAFGAAVDRWDALLGPDQWPCYTLNNHDQPRSNTRYRARGPDRDRERVAAALLLTLRGTPFVYYGEELGLKDRRLRRSEIQDPLGKRYWPLHPGRDPARTPMPWTRAEHAGFSRVQPWLPLNRDYRSRNVEAQRRTPTSLWNWYRELIALRRQWPALRAGDYRRMAQPHRDVLAYERTLGDCSIGVWLNFARTSRPAFIPGPTARHVLASHALPAMKTVSPGTLDLPGLCVLVAMRGDTPAA